MLTSFGSELLRVKLKSDDTKWSGLTVRAVEWQPMQVGVGWTNDSIVVFARTVGRTMNKVERCDKSLPRQRLLRASPL